MAPTLLLVDGTSEIYRAYYAFRDLQARSGEPSGAAFGFALSLKRLFTSETPTHAAVAFDLPARTFRHDAYEDYKATRKRPPQEMIVQIPTVKEIVSASGVSVLELAGYEADDLIATITTRARGAGFRTLIAAQDKDFLQLLEAGVSILNPRKGEGRIGPEDVPDLIGVPAASVPDLLALMGDSSDNIPGVDGIGEKHARRLIARFGSLEGVLANLNAIENPKLRKNLEEQRERAILSLSLARMHRDVPIAVGPADLVVRPSDTVQLSRLFQRLDLNSLPVPLFPPPQPRQGDLFA